MSKLILCLYNFQHVQSLFAALAVQKYFGVSNVVMEASNYRATSVVARRRGEISAIVVIGMGYTFDTFPEFRYNDAADIESIPLVMLDDSDLFLDNWNHIAPHGEVYPEQRFLVASNRSAKVSTQAREIALWDTLAHRLSLPARDQSVVDWFTTNKKIEAVYETVGTHNTWGKGHGGSWLIEGLKVRGLFEWTIETLAGVVDEAVVSDHPGSQFGLVAIRADGKGVEKFQSSLVLKLLRGKLATPFGQGKLIVVFSHMAFAEKICDMTLAHGSELLIIETLGNGEMFKYRWYHHSDNKHGVEHLVKLLGANYVEEYCLQFYSKLTWMQIRDTITTNTNP